MPVTVPNNEGLMDNLHCRIAGETLLRYQGYKTMIHNYLYWSYVDWNGLNADGTTYSSANASAYEVKVYSNY